jgi:hypothetical protein
MAFSGQSAVIWGFPSVHASPEQPRCLGMHCKKRTIHIKCMTEFGDFTLFQSFFVIYLFSDDFL